MNTSLLLCTDLDRTLIPNGDAPESPAARGWFHQLVASPNVILAYVSGRHRALIEAAMIEYALPLPQYVIADVGTTLYSVTNDGWQLLCAWTDQLIPNWPEPALLQQYVQFFPALTLQPTAQQAPYKVSYQLPAASVNDAVFCQAVQDYLIAKNSNVRLIWSCDDATNTGLLDIVPIAASKRTAIEFLQQLPGVNATKTVFAGDSGNDLDVLVSPIPAVLVANATAALRTSVQQQAAALHWNAQLYCAQGGWAGMNGNYSAGIIEGVAHFYPEMTAHLW
ncbi:HAD-IIB family hydrolase [Chromatium okenii]|uniref:Haloacid dehalogenase n=1 Tax=Chromatium okenii TaxID=61644 RepID=A0A2S7XUE0_9GAMM|nr:HAD-IIB family hydrolase [Chromatium okenii]PQJ97133.1 haloacid dehalogenase [Chromatium okenii]